MPLDPSIPHQDITYQIIGKAMRIHSRLGPGLKEQHYQHALSKELQCAGLTALEEHPIEIFDGDCWLGRLYLDLLSVMRSHPLWTRHTKSRIICYREAALFAAAIRCASAAQRIVYFP